MKENPYRENKDEINDLLKQYENLKTGRSHKFLDEEAFEKIVEFYDENEDLQKALEAAELGSEQYPFSSSLLIKKADILLSLRRYLDALKILEQAELFDGGDINLYILKTDVLLALDQQEKAVELLKKHCVHLTERKGLNCYLSWPMFMMIMNNLTRYLIVLS